MNRFSGYRDRALETGERALAIARELDLREQIAYSLNDLAHQYNRDGLYDKTKAALRETTQLWRELDNLPMVADSLSTAGYVHTFTGDLDEAVAFAQEALAISESIGNIWGISYSQWAVGRVYWERGDAGRAIRTMQDSIAYAEKAGFMVAQAYTRADLALVTGHLGDISGAIRIAQKGQDVVAGKMPLFEPYVLAQLARLYLMNGDIEKAEQTIQAMRATGGPVHVNRPDMVTLVECMLPMQRGDPPGSIRLFEKRLAELRRHGLGFFLPESLYLLGQSLAAAQRVDEAVLSFEEGLQEARARGMRWPEWQLLLALAKHEGGEQAALLRAKALEIVIAIAENVDNAELRQSFLKREEIKEGFDAQPPGDLGSP